VIGPNFTIPRTALGCKQNGKSNNERPGTNTLFSLFMPLNHAVAISRAIFLGAYTRGLIFNFLVIFVLELFAFLIGVRLMKKCLIK
jgi:hypothetical protein